jgi:hypothetical protein
MEEANTHTGFNTALSASERTISKNIKEPNNTISQHVLINIYRTIHQHIKIFLWKSQEMFKIY